ncbi:DUF5753 domain-containing protein [Actinocatenispora thailandica]|nr:DUF5753 domain-containing protein [Actinocatenispora thailandica]
MYVGLESAVDHIRHYNAELVPGLLQVEDYCRAVYRVSSTKSYDEIDQQVALRMDRQALLVREEPAAPQFDVFLNEAVLRRPVGGRDVMVKQLARLLESTDLSNVDVRVLSFAQAEHAGMMGTFVVLGFPHRQEPDVVYLESPTGALYLEKPKELTSTTSSCEICSNEHSTRCGRGPSSPP